MSTVPGGSVGAGAAVTAMRASPCSWGFASLPNAAPAVPKPIFRK
jgi:hypothetical protein